MSYTFKPGPEMVWFVVVAIATVVLQAIVTQGATAPTDMSAWLLGVGVAAVRAVLGALLQLMSSSGAQQ